ncbi:MAG: hypothetical protein IPN75_06055 [Dechloromonas sp.]|uniref:Beta-ketoacyl synthase C-terminal domain-containing protein n=1 Tax=Candidatus Dechloromonas phosphorivorans TaxID=2899244 RepID=A0A9D7LLF5_9RHOO|nr:hypothetical protein [Candidatus Dechloromonas phosphorivorans]
MGPAEIELIKLQAAGSPGTDLAEGNALRQVFGIYPPPLLSLKPYLGHTLGASGIVELVTLLACPGCRPHPPTPPVSRKSIPRLPCCRWLTAAMPISSGHCST